MKRHERSPSPLPVVPRRPRSVLRTRAGDAWLEAAKRPRLGNGSGRHARRHHQQAQPLDYESDRELDVAEALFDLANVAVAFSEQAEHSADNRPPLDAPHRHSDKHRRAQVKSRGYSAYEEPPSPRSSSKVHPGSQSFTRGPRFHKHPASVGHRPPGRSPYGPSGPHALSDAVAEEAVGPAQSLSVPKAVKAARPMVSLDAQLPVDASSQRAGLSQGPGGSIAAFFPGSTLPRGPYQDSPGLGHRAGASEGDSAFAAGEACPPSGAVQAISRRPLKHCAFHVYIAQFIEYHMRRSRAKEEDQHSRPPAYTYQEGRRLDSMDAPTLDGRLSSTPGPSGSLPASSSQGPLLSRKASAGPMVKAESGPLPNGHAHPAQNGFSAQNAQAPHMPPSLLSYAAQQASPGANAGHFGGAAPPNNGAARMVSSALAALGPQYGLPNMHLMQPPTGFPFLAHGGHLAGSPPPFGPLPPGLTAQQVASLAAMGSLFAGGPHGPSLQPFMQAPGAFPAPAGSAMPPHMAAAASAASMPHHSHPNGSLLGPHPRLEMQGEHSPAEPGLQHQHQHQHQHRRAPAPAASLPEGSGALRGPPRPTHLPQDALHHLRHLGLPAGMMAASGHPLPPGLAEQLMAAAQHGGHPDGRRSSLPVMQ